MTYIAPEMNPNDMPDESVKPTPFQGLAVLTTSDQAAVEAFIARATLAHEFPMQGGRATGMDELDAELALLPGSLTSIIAREGVGKSSIALQWARWMSGGGRVVYVLTEMTRWDVTARLVAQVAHMSVRDVKTPRTPEQLAEVEKATRWVANHIDITFVEAQGQSVNYIVTEVRRLHHELGSLRAVFVDNLWGIVGPSGVNGNAFQVSRGISGIVDSLSRLAKEPVTGGVDCPVVLVHHANRGGGKPGEAPSLDQVGGSIGVAQFSDNVVQIVKEGGIDANPDATFSPSGAPTHKLWVTKNREGRNVGIDLHFIGPEMRFQEAGPARAYTPADAIDHDREAAYMERLRNLPKL